MKKLKDIISDIDESVWKNSMDGSNGQDCGFTES
jgi:hypothetical protein